MNSSVKFGVILAVVVLLVSVAFIGSGLHLNPLANLGVIVLNILIDCVVVFLALRTTKDVNGYAAQLGNSALLGVVAGVLIMLGSWVLMSFVFPDAIAEMNDATIDFLHSAGASEEQIAQAEQRAAGTTAWSQAWPGLIGTFFTSLLFGGVASIFLRKK